MKTTDLIGKTITNVVKLAVANHDDEPALHLTFSDGTSYVIEASYGGYTGESEDEYIQGIYIRPVARPGLVVSANQNVNHHDDPA